MTNSANVIRLNLAIFSPSFMMDVRFMLMCLINEGHRKRVAEDDYFGGPL